MHSKEIQAKWTGKHTPFKYTVKSSESLFTQSSMHMFHGISLNATKSSGDTSISYDYILLHRRPSEFLGDHWDTLKVTACVNADTIWILWECTDRSFSDNNQYLWTFLKMFLNHLLLKKNRRSIANNQSCHRNNITTVLGNDNTL